MINRLLIIVTIFSLSLHLLSTLELKEVTDNEIKELSETLFTKDENNAGRFVVLNMQGYSPYGSNDDLAAQPLLTIDRRAYDIKTISKLLKLYDNYSPDVGIDEVVTQSEKQEETDFLNAVLNTTVMEKTKLWLSEKGLIPQNNFRNFLSELWFTMYSRGKKKTGSSAFEHIFLGEVKNNEVSGLHNWVFFGHEEKRNQLNYFGWKKKIEFPEKKGGVVKLRYDWGNIKKFSGAMFIGTSPELEMALYTVCFLVRPNKVCHTQLGGKSVNIQTHVLTQNNKRLIGSAYPAI